MNLFLGTPHWPSYVSLFCYSQLPFLWLTKCLTLKGVAFNWLCVCVRAIIPLASVPPSYFIWFIYLHVLEFPSAFLSRMIRPRWNYLKGSLQRELISGFEVIYRSWRYLIADRVFSGSLAFFLPAISFSMHHSCLFSFPRPFFPSCRSALLRDGARTKAFPHIYVLLKAIFTQIPLLATSFST